MRAIPEKKIPGEGGGGWQACNEHVEMNKFLCSLACTWMTIIDSQFYIIDSLSLDVSLE